MVDEELLLHRLCDQCSSERGESFWHDLLAWLTARESDGKLKRFQHIDQMKPTSEGWQVPSITTVAQLATFLDTSLSQLESLADRWQLRSHQCTAAAQHYRYRWVKQRSGKVRLLEIPKLRLKTLQRRILDAILNQVPAHPAAHGFRAGHSTLANALPHVQQHVVIRFDLADFFPSVHFSKVMAIFRRMGYPRPVARYLAALCTNTTPEDVRLAHPAYQRDALPWLKTACFQERHLPQGAPTSPALANLAAHRLDRRLSAWAEKLGWNYTRYADDITISGDRSLGRDRLKVMTWLATIVGQEGFQLRLQKTHLMRSSQRQEVCGVVVNETPNLRRSEYDLLKAILHNCKRMDLPNRTVNRMLIFAPICEVE